MEKGKPLDRIYLSIVGRLKRAAAGIVPPKEVEDIADFSISEGFGDSGHRSSTRRGVWSSVLLPVLLKKLDLTRIE